MSDSTQQPIVVKRPRKAGGGHHGGVWKIAYADFVTAMMAFFLLMWLIGSTAKGDLNGIAEYFSTPLKVAMQGGSGSGDASSVVQGGGQDLSRSAGQVKRGDIEAKKRTVNLQALPAEREKIERMRLEELKSQVERVIDASLNLRQYKNQLLIDLTSEGLRIQIIDALNRPMFDLSSAELKPYAREILREIGRTLNAVDNKISLSGHTDATGYVGGERGFSNWELSANRANASRRELVAGGMDENKIVRVVGLASTVLFDKLDPNSPINRRISVVVMNKRTEEAVIRDESGVQEKDESDGAETSARVAPEAAATPPKSAPAGGAKVAP
ncbi:MAG: flagellar motor protein MotB [Pirellulaceae bacterium]|jgi:chemotaxis protein MotB|nr:flagellar motor protein MotB [Pirellulaceae bacterium]